MGSKTPELTLYKIMLHGERTQEPHMEAELVMKVAAATREDAEEIVRSSLPGFDWKWQSMWGLVPVNDDVKPA